MIEKYSYDCNVNMIACKKKTLIEQMIFKDILTYLTDYKL